MLIDTHCHCYLDDFAEDREEIFSRAYANGVREIFLPAITLASLPQMDNLHFSGIHFHKMAGLHPCDVTPDTILTDEELLDAITSYNCVALGETGLDYYWSTEHVALQQQSLSQHLELGKALDKAVILHNRESNVDLLNKIVTHQDGRLRGIWHCFNGTVEEGKSAIDAGFYLGIGGVLTFKNAGVDKVVSQLPLERLVLETDAPYLAPVPHRGKRNEPSYIRLVAEKLATLFEMSVEELGAITSTNAHRLFFGDTI